MSTEPTYERAIRDVRCPQCGKPFRLTWNDYTNIGPDYLPQTLIFRDCPSGGVYDVRIKCPHCTYEEDL